jgi:hypothetical protein
MGTYGIGYLIGTLIVPLALAIWVIVKGWGSQSRKPGGGSAAAKFAYVALGIVVFVVAGAIALYLNRPR